MMGLNDKEIGAKIGCSQGQIFRWRKSNLLSANGNTAAKISPQRNEEIIRLHRQGFNDVEIAAQLGISHDIVRLHRRKLGLEPNKKRRTAARGITPEEAIKEVQFENEICLNCNLPANKCTGNCPRFYKLSRK